MAAPILLTKLFIPATRPELVSRTRLIEQLNLGLTRKLTLISAPAGFGKTTLVTEWLNTNGDDTSSPFVVAWFSLDEGDNDVVRFLTYLISSLKLLKGFETDIGDGVLQMLQSPQPPPAESILTALINELALLSEKIVLILDDYHLIDSQPVHDILQFLLENLPPQLHLVITTREDPPIPVSRLRASGQLNELRAIDLRFTLEETAKFLNQVMGLNLSTADIAALETRTEGWIAGLQMAAISIQGSQDVEGFIKSFTGSHRYILDYLIEEVLESQSTSVQMFMLQTAILDQLSGSLCNAVTDQENGQETLEMLERANLFIIPLDELRRWYRYHHLFAELLAQQLRRRYPDLINDLHARAVIWYEANDLLEQAIHHALSRDDIRTAVRLIEKGALAALERSDFGFILNAVKRIPDWILERSPWLFVYYCWALLLTGQPTVVILKLENTDWLLDSLSGSEDQKQKMYGYIAGLKILLLAWQRNFEQLNYYYDQVKATLPENHWIRAYSVMVMGVRFWNQGNLSAAIDSFKIAGQIGKAIGNKRVTVTSAGYLGYALELKGNLRQAVKVYHDGFQSARQNGNELPVACYLHNDCARIFCELNGLVLAKDHIIKGIEQSQLLADERTENIGHGLATRIYLACGDFEMAANSVRDTEKFIPSPDIVYDMRGSEFPYIRLWLNQNKHQEIDSWLKNNNVNLDPSLDFKTRMTYAMHARAMIALARDFTNGNEYLSRAQDLLDALLDLAESNGWGSRVIEILILQSLAYDLTGDKKSAMTALERALLLAEPEGFIRIFVDEGPSMAKLLYDALSKNIAPDYVRKLLAAFPDAEPEKVDEDKPTTSDFDWIEPLSDRELEVLQLIAAGFSRQEIAAKLVLSLNTVKTHVRNIYSKLGVNNQMQAVGKARTLGLIETA